jgi:UDP-glucose-4-epimerase GalE
MPTALVTGGAGYIGAHTAAEFAAKGWNVVVFDDLSRGWEDFARFGPLVRGDIRDEAALRACLREHKIDAVVHCAALIEVAESAQKPNLYYDVNVGGLLALLRAMDAEGVRALVFSTSCATYGPPQRLPLTEDHPQAPISPYGMTKLIGEFAIKDAAKTGRLSFALLRYFNACGAHPEHDIGERHEPESHLIPNAIRAANGLGAGLKVFGQDYDTRDGTCLRDYVHVCDLARAHVMAAGALLGGAEPMTLNLGSGDGFTVMEVIQAVEAATGRRVPWTAAPRREGDPPALFANADAALQRLGWRTERSDLATILADASAWHARDDVRRGLYQSVSVKAS